MRTTTLLSTALALVALVSLPASASTTDLRAALQKQDRAAVKQILSGSPDQAGAYARTIVQFVREGMPNNVDFLTEQMDEMGRLCSGDMKAEDADRKSVV